MKHSRRYLANREGLDPVQVHSVSGALEILKGLRAAKFDETVEVHTRLGVDPKKSDQMVRGAVSLPHGLGKDVRVIAFAEGDMADAAREGGLEF